MARNVAHLSKLCPKFEFIFLVCIPFEYTVHLRNQSLGSLCLFRLYRPGRKLNVHGILHRGTIMYFCPRLWGSLNIVPSTCEEVVCITEGKHGKKSFGAKVLRVFAHV